MVKDTISSGDQISGVGYKVTSSYNNGKLVGDSMISTGIDKRVKIQQIIDNQPQSSYCQRVLKLQIF